MKPSIISDEMNSALTSMKAPLVLKACDELTRHCSAEPLRDLNELYIRLSTVVIRSRFYRTVWTVLFRRSFKNSHVNLFKAARNGWSGYYRQKIVVEMICLFRICSFSCWKRCGTSLSAIRLMGYTTSEQIWISVCSWEDVYLWCLPHFSRDSTTIYEASSTASKAQCASAFEGFEFFV